MNKRTLIYSLVGAIIIVIFGFVMLRKSTFPHMAKTTRPGPLPTEQTIILTIHGFSPKETAVKAGTSVRWINNLGKQATVNSDNYPTNQLHRELNLGIVANGSSVMYIFTNPGSYGYHDQFNPNFTGIVIVEK